MITTHAQVLVPLKNLVGADYNPREMPEDEMQKLMRSLEEFGFVEPVVARREDGLLVGGHQRVTAMRRLLTDQGATEADIADTTVPVIFLDGLTDERTKLLNLALNKIHGEWDYLKLGELFSTLDSTAIPLELSGFSSAEIEDIMNLTDHTTGLGVGQEAEPLDVDALIAAQARRFMFEVKTDQEAQACRDVLKLFGMTGPGNAATAFVAALQVALAATNPAAATGAKKK